MWFNSSLAALNIWITYFLQVVFGYLATLCICALIQNPRIRMRMWGCFLLLTIVAWPVSWLPSHTSAPVPDAFHSASSMRISGLHVVLPVRNLQVLDATQLVSTVWRLYVFLLVVSLLHLLFKSIRLGAVLRQTQPASPQVQVLFRSLCLQFRIRGCELGLVSGLQSPATCYWLQSHVLLPTELVHQLDSDQLVDVLRHELIHVRRRDYLWDRLAALGCRLVFFHPLVWLGYRRLRWERELGCDQGVIAQRSEARLRYAECLAMLGRRLVRRNSLSEGIGFSSSASLLATRVRALLNEPTSCSARQKATRGGLILVVTMAAVCCLPSLGVTLYLPLPLMSWSIRSHSTDSSPTSWKKSAVRKPHHSSGSKALAAPSPLAIAQTSGPQRPVDLYLAPQSPSLPVLRDSVAAADTTELVSTCPRKTEDGVGALGSHAAWDESPMPLASARAPNWRKIVTGVIKGGVAIVTGRIDVDDVDAPRKRAR
jgi:beta-lactamase regulating signal transducer with metallopeptidase domain